MARIGIMILICNRKAKRLEVDFPLFNFREKNFSINFFSGNVCASQFPPLIHNQLNSLSVEDIMDDIGDTILLLWLFRKRRKSRRLPEKKNQTKLRFRPIFRETKLKGEFHRLIQDLQSFDSEYFLKQFRMTPTKLEELWSLVAPKIENSSVRREKIDPEQRLCVTPRYLLTGDAHVTIAASYRISPTSIGMIIKETTCEIWDVLLEKGYLQPPQSSKDWVNISRGFENR